MLKALKDVYINKNDLYNSKEEGYVLIKKDEEIRPKNKTKFLNSGYFIDFKKSEEVVEDLASFIPLKEEVI